MWGRSNFSGTISNQGLSSEVQDRGVTCRDDPRQLTDQTSGLASDKLCGLRLQQDNLLISSASRTEGRPSSPPGKVVSSALPGGFITRYLLHFHLISIGRSPEPKSGCRFLPDHPRPHFRRGAACDLESSRNPAQHHDRPLNKTIQHVGATFAARHGESRVCRTSTQVSVNQSGVFRHPTLSHHLPEKGRVRFWHQRSLTSLRARADRRVLGHSSHHWNHCIPKRKQTFILTLLAGQIFLI